MAGDSDSSVLPITHGCNPPVVASFLKSLSLCLVTSSQREGLFRKAGNRYLCCSCLVLLLLHTYCVLVTCFIV